MVREFCLRAELRFVERSSIILQYGVVLRHMYIIRRGVVEVRKVKTLHDYGVKVLFMYVFKIFRSRFARVEIIQLYTNMDLEHALDLEK